MIFNKKKKQEVRTDLEIESTADRVRNDRLSARKKEDAAKEVPKKEDKKDGQKPKKGGLRFADVFAFLSLTTAALLLVVGPIIDFFAGEDAQQTITVLNTVVQYCMLAAAAIPAFYFVRRKKSGWIVFYIVVLIVYLVGTVLGLI